MLQWERTVANSLREAGFVNFLLILVCTIIGVFVLREPIRRWPWVFYILAIALDIFLFASWGMTLPSAVNIQKVMLMVRGGLATALFIVVMYMGVLPRGSKVSKWLRPIRAELSIIVSFLIAGHMVHYLVSFGSRMLGGSSPADNVAAAIIVGIIMMVFVIVLGVTSFRFVKRHMNVRTWRKLQSGAYVFYVLIFVHVACMLGPSAVRGGTTALINLIVYSVILISYMVLRIMRAKADKRDKVDLTEAIIDQGFQDK